MWTQQDAATFEPVWILEFFVEKRAYRYTSADEPVTVTRSDGIEHLYQPGLLDIRIANTDESVAVSISDRVDWANLAANGCNLEGGRAILRRYWTGIKLETAPVWGRGLVRFAEFGEVTDPLVFNVTAGAELDSGLLLPANAKSVGSMQAGVYDVYEQTLGSPFPIVIGYPGDLQDSGNNCIPVVPAILTDYFRTSSPANTLSRAVFSLFPCEATKVQVSVPEATNTAGRLLLTSYPDAPTGLGSFPSVEDGEPFNLPVSYFDFTGTLANSMVATFALPGTQDASASFFVGFVQADGGGGMKNPYGEGILRGAGDVIIWALRSARGDLVVDFDALENLRARLNAFQIDVFLNDPEVRSLDWIRKTILSVLPVVEINGPNGWALAWFDYTANESDVLGQLKEGVNVSRSSPAAVVNGDKIANEITVEYRPDDRGFVSQVTITPDFYAKGYKTLAGGSIVAGEIVDPSYPHKIAKTSKSRHGVRRLDVGLAQTWDDRTAVLIATNFLIARALGLTAVTYSGLSNELEHARPGDVYQITDEAMSWDARIAIVQDVTIGGGSPPEVSLILPDPLLKRPKGD